MFCDFFCRVFLCVNNEIFEWLNGYWRGYGVVLWCDMFLLLVVWFFCLVRVWFW